MGSGENDEVISVEMAGVTEGVRGSEGNTRDDRAKSDSKTVNQHDWKEREKEFCLAQCQNRPRVKRQSHQDVLGTGNHRGNWRGDARDDP